MLSWLLVGVRGWIDVCVCCSRRERGWEVEKNGKKLKNSKNDVDSSHQTVLGLPPDMCLIPLFRVPVNFVGLRAPMYICKSLSSPAQCTPNFLCLSLSFLRINLFFELLPVARFECI